MKYYVCEGCEAEIREFKPEHCPLCGRNDFSEYDKEEMKDPEDEKYNEVYKKVLKELEKYNEGTEPEDFKNSFAD